MKKNKTLYSMIYSLIIILVFGVQNVFAATIKKEIEVETKDSFIIKGTLCYPKVKEKRKFPTVVLLHSLGYSSSRWTAIQDKLTEAGYAWIMVDLRGHGKSVYTGSFKKVSWRNFKLVVFKKYPSDVNLIIKEAAGMTNRITFNNWAIIGGDIGANTGVLVAKDSEIKPKALVLLNPSTSYKGLYIPIAMTEIGTVPILTIASQRDAQALRDQATLKKFAQGEYDELNLNCGGSGMLLLQREPELASAIVKWLDERMK